jgi:hypothetical protein
MEILHRPIYRGFSESAVVQIDDLSASHLFIFFAE